MVDHEIFQLPHIFSHMLFPAGEQFSYFHEEHLSNVLHNLILIESCNCSILKIVLYWTNLIDICLNIEDVEIFRLLWRRQASPNEVIFALIECVDHLNIGVERAVEDPIGFSISKDEFECHSVVAIWFPETESDCHSFIEVIQTWENEDSLPYTLRYPQTQQDED